MGSHNEILPPLLLPSLQSARLHRSFVQKKIQNCSDTEDFPTESMLSWRLCCIYLNEKRTASLPTAWRQNFSPKHARRSLSLSLFFSLFFSCFFLSLLPLSLGPLVNSLPPHGHMFSFDALSMTVCQSEINATACACPKTIPYEHTTNCTHLQSFKLWFLGPGALPSHIPRWTSSCLQVTMTRWKKVSHRTLPQHVHTTCQEIQVNFEWTMKSLGTSMDSEFWYATSMNRVAKKCHFRF